MAATRTAASSAVQVRRPAPGRSSARCPSGLHGTEAPGYGGGGVPRTRTTAPRPRSRPRRPPGPAPSSAPAPAPRCLRPRTPTRPRATAPTPTRCSHGDVIADGAVAAPLRVASGAAATGSGVHGGVGAVWGAAVGDEPDDLALFRRATLEASSVEGVGGAAAGSRPPKVAFLFLTFAPLWERFFARLTVYVHADPAARLRLPPTRSFRGRFVRAKPTRRADPSLIAAARRLLAAALLDDPANRPRPPLFPPPSAASHHRPPSYIEVLAGEPQLPSRYVARGEDAMLPEVPYNRFRIGSQFFALARRHAALVVRERRLWRKFRLPCLPEAQDSCYPEEHYFPTLLDMADPAGVAGYTLTRVNWTGSVAGHPHTYTAPEVTPGLIAELRASNNTHPYMFARKFAPECLGPLLDIADTVIFKD